MIKASLPLPFSLLGYWRKTNQPVNFQPRTRAGKPIDILKPKTFPFPIPPPNSRSLPLFFFFFRRRYNAVHNGWILIEPPATSLFSRKDGITLKLNDWTRLANAGLCTWPVIEPAHNGRCSSERGFEGSFAVDIDRENGQTLYISLLLDRKGNRVLSFLPRFLSLFIHVSRSIYCESILNDIFFTHLYSTIIDFFKRS